jgi:hypothetical protein
LSGEIREVEVVAVPDVVFAEWARIARGFQPFVDLDVDRKLNVVEAAGAFALCNGVDRAQDFDSPAQSPDSQLQSHECGKPEIAEVRDRDCFANDDLAARRENGGDVD